MNHLLYDPKSQLFWPKCPLDCWVTHHFLQYLHMYSGVPNSGTGTNNSTGWEKYENLIIVQDGINVIGGIYPKIK